MSSRKKPCPGCRQGSSDLTSGRFKHHFSRYCTKSFLKEPAPARSAKRSHITYDSHSNPAVPRNPLMASDTLTSSSVSENPFKSEGSPHNPPEEASAPVLSELTSDNEVRHISPCRLGINTQHDVADLRDKKRKAQGITHGSMHFQVQLLGILQKHGCSMKMHDKIIDLVNTGLTTGSLRANNPPLLSRTYFESSRTGFPNTETEATE